MKPIRRILLMVCLAHGLSSLTAAQPTHMTKQAVDNAVSSSKLDLGPLRVTPFFVLNSGYDSNSLSSPGFPEQDLSLRAGPGARLLLPFAQRGYLEVTPELEYVYYREQESLRNLNKRLTVGGLVGSRRLTFEFENGYEGGIVRPSSEFDVPVDVRQNRTILTGAMLFGWRQILRLSYAFEDYGVRGGTEELSQQSLDARLGRKTHRYGLELERYMSSRTRLLVEVFGEQLNFDDSVARDASTLGFGGGLAFGSAASLRGASSSRRGMFGRAVIGYERTEPDDVSQAEFSGLTAAVDAGFGFRDRDRVAVIFGRDLGPSILVENWFFVEDRVGMSLTTYLHPRFFLSPAVYFSRNTYPLPELVLDDLGELGLGDVKDRQWTYTLGLNAHLSDTIVFRVNLDYLKRQSNFTDFSKDRFVVGAGVSLVR